MFKSLVTFAVIASVMLLFSCSKKSTEPTPTKSEFEVVQTALDTYLSGDLAPVIKADALHADSKQLLCCQRSCCRWLYQTPYSWRTVAKTEK